MSKYVRFLMRCLWWLQDTVGFARGLVLFFAIGTGLFFLLTADKGLDRISIVNATGTFCAVIVALFPSRPTDRIWGHYVLYRYSGKYKIRCVIHNVGKTIVTMGNYDSDITDSGAIIIANIFDKHNNFVNILQVEMKKTQNRDFSSLRVLPGMAQEYTWDDLSLPRSIDVNNLKIVVFTSTGLSVLLSQNKDGSKTQVAQFLMNNRRVKQNVVYKRRFDKFDA